VPLPQTLPLAPDLGALALAAASEGCRDETLSALVAARAAATASDTVVKRVLEQIADDEARHAALSWRVLRWALKGCGPKVRERVQEILTAPPPTLNLPIPDDPVLAAQGVLGHDAVASCFEDGMRSVVHPTWALLGASPV